MTQEQKIELLEQTTKEATIIIARFLLFISINDLEEEYQEFVNGLQSFMDNNMHTDRETFEEDFKKYIKEYKNGGVRNA